MSHQFVVDVRSLSVQFGRSSKPVVQDLTLQIAPGEAVGLVGESGSGKSVTARTLIGLTGDGATVSASHFEVLGRNGLTMGEREWRKIRGRGIGFVLQDALGSLDPIRPIGKEIAEVLRQHKVVPASEFRKRSHELLRAVGVPDAEYRADQYPFELSGGLRQRALIATAIAANPQLIIADEPSTALDVTVQAQVMNLLDQRRKSGTALLLVSHDLAVVAQVCSRIIVMKQGRVVEQGVSAELLTNPQHPYTQELLAAIPSAHSRGNLLSAAVPTPAPARRIHHNDIVLRAEHLNKSFDAPGGTRLRAVKEVNFEIAQGETLGIVGESGSGKSTVANIALGLVTVDSGEVTLLENRWNPSRERLRRPLRHLVQSVPQDPLGSFDPRYSVAQVVGEPLRSQQLSRAQLKNQVLDAVHLVGLDPDRLNDSPRLLSGGQRQRVAIARALILQPRLLVADEPVSALDVSVQAQVLDLLVSVQSRTGVSVIFISHDLGVVHHLADRVLVMKDGRVLESGSADDVFFHPKAVYTKTLLGARPTLPAVAI